MLCSETLMSPLRYLGNCSMTPGTVSSVMKPSRPMFMPNRGIPWGAMARLTRKIVPSPPMVITKSLPSARTLRSSASSARRIHVSDPRFNSPTIAWARSRASGIRSL